MYTISICTNTPFTSDQVSLRARRFRHTKKSKWSTYGQQLERVDINMDCSCHRGLYMNHQLSSDVYHMSLAAVNFFHSQEFS